MVDAHEFFNGDVIFAGNFPEAVTGFDGVEFFWLRRRGGFCWDDGWGDGLGGGKLGEEAAEGELVVVGFGEGFSGEGEEEGGGALSEGIGAWGGEEFFREGGEDGGFIGIEVEEGEDLGIVEVFGDEIGIGIEEDFGGEFGVVLEGVEEEEASTVGCEVELCALPLIEIGEGFPLAFRDEVDDLFAGDVDAGFCQECVNGVVFGREVESIEKGGIAWNGGAFQFVEKALAGEGPLFCFGILEDGLELVIGKAGENRDIDRLLSLVIGKGNAPLLQGEAAEGFIEIEMVKGDKTGEP